MSRKPNTVGGGAQTNINGLHFEERMNLLEALKTNPEIEVIDNDIYRDGNLVAQYFKKHGLYSKLLKPKGVDYKTILSRQLLPDGALLVGKTIYIIEKKYQEGKGSVDEKLQTCDFKKKQYQKLFKPLNITVEYYYVLNKWFDQAIYNDVFEYIESVGCRYFIEDLPFKEIGF